MEKPERSGNMGKDTKLVISFLTNLPCQNKSNFVNMEQAFHVGVRKSSSNGRPRCYKNVPSISIQTQECPKPKGMVTEKPDPFMHRQRRNRNPDLNSQRAKSSITEGSGGPIPRKRMKQDG